MGLHNREMRELISMGQPSNNEGCKWDLGAPAPSFSGGLILWQVLYDTSDGHLRNSVSQLLTVLTNLVTQSLLSFTSSPSYFSHVLPFSKIAFPINYVLLPSCLENPNQNSWFFRAQKAALQVRIWNWITHQSDGK